ncbi:DUF378 domain-containing protein [Niallia alba]|uniref:DUF378 domain-containing protein n=1 Tax=Niallia circulans TaxID=1397 RepID=A0A941GQF6_NIACI|nr:MULTISPECIES: DUF378 domain-containing protein [Niallia]MCB5239130.1 DUF378 domain-containing protein [Niallia circulans]MED3793383.1 DUF378 domain-containing protein [Niallia alba]
MSVLQKIALILMIIGAINWGLIGLFQFDLVAAIFGGQHAGLARIIYSIVGIAGLLSISLLFPSKSLSKNSTKERTVY